jgi:alanyl-tRNA synthetase
MTTELLHYADPRGSEFEARVVEHATFKGRPSVVLDRTGFYAEAGGQMADRGTLGDVAVADVQIDDAGRVHHVLDGALPAVGDLVRGAIDAGRRRVHRALHTGQHVLSRALLDEAQAETVSSRLGETACTIDVDRDGIPERELARAEDLANAIADDDLRVRAWFPSPAELAGLPLRRAPKVDGAVRIVAVGDFDYTPCGGTHCDNSAQIGTIRITGIERYKGGTRVTFVAGRRARQDHVAAAGVLRDLSRLLTCGPQDLAGNVEKLRRDLQSARDALGVVRARLADREAQALLAAGGTRFVAAFPDADADFLRVVARRLAQVPSAVVALAATNPEGTRLLVTRGPGATLDCGALVKAVAQATGGRGGGRPDGAEANLPPNADWQAVLTI